MAVKANDSARSAAGPRAPAATPRRVFATRRRLVAAFSAVLVASLSALVFQAVALRRMETTFGDMKDHEEQMRLALELAHAVRDQHEHQEQIALGEAGRIGEYEAARERALAIGRDLGARLDEPEAISWLTEIRAAGDELDRQFREQIAPASQDASRWTAVEHVRSYLLVSLIQDDVDRISARLQRAASTFREQLASFEAASLRWTALLLFALPAFVAGLVLFLSRSVARPLARLSEGAAAVAGGDLGVRIDIDTPDEFGALAGEFNAMTLALREHQERLVEAEKLAGIGRLAAGVAHEINNPLQVMIGYLSLNRGHPDRRLAEQLEAVEAEAVRCKQIVDGLLELARPGVDPARVDLREVCEDVAAGLRVSALPPGSRLAVSGAGSALGSGPKLRQVMLNLMKNAVESAGSGGRVEVRIAAADDAHVEVAVCDSGPGIPAPARARLFEPFFTTKPAGTGLGLAVSRAIALAHGGDIDVEDGDLGGATFTLRLPSAPARADVDRPGVVVVEDTPGP